MGPRRFDEGDVVSLWSDGDRFQSQSDLPIRSAQHRRCVAYKFKLAAGESRTWAVCVPFSQRSDSAAGAVANRFVVGERSGGEYVRERQAAVVEKWREATDKFELLVPAKAEQTGETPSARRWLTSSSTRTARRFTPARGRTSGRGFGTAR